MRLLRFVKWATLFMVTGAIILVVGISIYFRIEQYRFRNRAERLLSDVRGLELENADKAQVKAVVSKWGFDEWQGPRKPCTEDDCIYRFELRAGSARIHELTDPFLDGPAARVLEWLGLRPTSVQAWVQIRGKSLGFVSFSVWTLGQGCNERGRMGCTLVSHASTKQTEGSWSSHEPPDEKLKHSLLHPHYLVGTLTALLNADTGGSPAVIIWTELSPDANTSDVSRLMQFDLSCITRIISCKDRDLMPTVWTQSVEDIRESPKSLTCTPEVSKRVAQLADVIAVVRPETVELTPPIHDGRSSRLRNLEMVKVIKKTEFWREAALLSVEIDRPEMMTTADTASPIRVGNEYIFLLQDHSTPNIGWYALYPCGVLSFNDSNLAIVREAASIK